MTSSSASTGRPWLPASVRVIHMARANTTSRTNILVRNDVRLMKYAYKECECELFNMARWLPPRPRDKHKRDAVYESKIATQCVSQRSI
ncbi:hypothetical protein WN944_028106 [Citrus x changshan-huyou]|uniref:Uncharacterized protein n=1 Tax=Citrus x changshan-huyou TaxID=2935761 RepID=A0AAP0LIS4_9ROSI